jgi:hypothetical protein
MNISRLRAKLLVTFIFPLLILIPGLFAGNAPVDGTEHWLWTDDQYSVIVARVVDIKPTNHREDPATYTATLEPIATLAGQLDPSIHRELHAVLHAGVAAVLTIHAPPSKGAIVLAVMIGEDKILSDAATFMPSRIPLVEIDGLDDKRVLETLHRIQEARAHQQPDRMNVHPAPPDAPAVKSPGRG